MNSRLKYLTELLTKSYEDHSEIIKIDSVNLLNQERIVAVLEKLRNLIFPGYFGKKNISFASVEYYTGDTLEEVFYSLSKEIAKALLYSPHYGGLEKEIIEKKPRKSVFSYWPGCRRRGNIWPKTFPPPLTAILRRRIWMKSFHLIRESTPLQFTAWPIFSTNWKSPSSPGL